MRIPVRPAEELLALRLWKGADGCGVADFERWAAAQNPQGLKCQLSHFVTIALPSSQFCLLEGPSRYTGPPPCLANACWLRNRECRTVIEPSESGNRRALVCGDCKLNVVLSAAMGARTTTMQQFLLAADLPPLLPITRIAPQELCIGGAGCIKPYTSITTIASPHAETRIQHKKAPSVCLTAFINLISWWCALR